MSNMFLKIFTIIALVFSYTSNSFAGFKFSNRNSTVRVCPGAVWNLQSAKTGWDGTLDEQTGCEIRGSSVTFDSTEYGILELANTPILFNGEYDGDPSTNQNLILGAGQVARIDAGAVTSGHRIIASGTSASPSRLEGQPLFADDSTSLPNIELTDATTYLTIAIQSKLNGFIKMNQGRVILENDLAFGDDKYPDNGVLKEATFDLNSHSLKFGGKDLTLTHTIQWLNSTDMVLNARTDLYGQWKFDGSGSDNLATLQGNGNVLDLHTTGTIWIKNGTTLHMTDVKLKGLGLDNGSIVFEDRDSVLKLTNSTIELAANYTVTTGNVYVEGPTTIITKNSYLDFDIKGSLSVDGQTMYYDTLGYEDNGNIRFGHASLSDPDFDSKNAAANLYLSAGSQIVRKEVEELGDIYWEGTDSGEDYKWPASDTVTLKKDMYLCTDRKLYVQDNRAMTLEGSGCAVEFSRDDNIINIASGSSITFQNVVLRNFSPQHITGSGTYTFGNDVIIELAPTEGDIADNPGRINLNVSWEFDAASGKFFIDCKGNTLQFDTSGKIFISGAAGELTIQNGTLQDIAGSGTDLYCSAATDVINLKDMNLTLSADYTIAQGIFNFYNNVVVKGLTATSADLKFIWTTGTTSSQIKADSSLTFDHNVTFSYCSGAPSKVGLAMADETAALVFNGSTLYSTVTGLRLATGNLFIDNRVTFTSEGRNTGEAIELGSNLNVEMLAGALLDVYGRIITD